MNILIAWLLVIFCPALSFGNVLKVDESDLKDITADNKLLLAFINPSKECSKDCQDSINTLQSVTLILSHLSINIADVYSPNLLKVFPSQKKEPKLFYYRNGIPLIFELESFDSEVISDWMMENEEVTLKSLNDDTFEHLTQASTGSTTGDWFIFFYSKKCNQYIPLWETLGVRLKHQKIVAIVDIDESPSLKERFAIKLCPHTIFLHHGRMYTYPLPVNDLDSLINFAQGWYKNVKSQKVPSEITPFDNLTTRIALWLKDNNMAFVAIVGAVVSTLLIFCSKYMFASSKDKSS